MSILAETATESGPQIPNNQAESKLMSILAETACSPSETAAAAKPTVL